MTSPTATKPDRLTGLPPGVAVGSLARRLVARLLDAVVPVALLLVILNVRGDRSTGGRAVIVVAVVLLTVWALLVWWMFATRAAGPGMRLMKLQLVGFTNGRPIGWGRFFVRTLVLALLTVTVLGLLVMLIFLLRHPRYQGWHDLAAGSVVISARPLAPRVVTSTRAEAPSPPARRQSAPPPDAPEPPQALTPPPGAGGPGPLPVPVPAMALPLAPSGVEVGAAALGPGGVAAGAAEPPGAAVDQGAAGVTARWVAVLDDGREVPVQGLVLLGRNPQPRPGEESAELIKLADESRTVSKSHLALGLDEAGLFVTDRGSTNGSTVTTPDGTRTRCTPGDLVQVAHGSVVSMGDRWLKVRRD
jgi:uncharacterized RDD family membrane protein YckC